MHPRSVEWALARVKIPKAGARDEPHGEQRHDGDRSDVARYELLRRRALAGDPGGWRCGLAVLQHRGVVAWLDAWQAVPSPRRARRRAAAPPRFPRPVSRTGSSKPSLRWRWLSWPGGELR